jgi:EpsI family protein
MAKKFLIYTILFALLCVAVFFVYDIIKFKNLPTKSTRILEFPMKLDGYQGKDLPLEQKVYDILNTDTIILRKYSKEEQQIPIWFLIVYGEQDRTSFHPPEYCYLGGGDVEILNKGVEILDLKEEQLSVNKLLLKMPAHRQLVYFWFTAGKKITSSYYKQQMFFVMEQMKRNKIGGTLIRVSTAIPEGQTEEQAKQRLIDFLELALPKIKEIL